MNNNYYAVIMAGGGGTRLWPLSTKCHPKQLVSINGKDSLFNLALNRLNGVFPKEHIFIVTNAAQMSGLQKLAPDIPESQYLIEPEPKGTAAVVGFAAITLAKKDPDAVMAVLTADHIIGNVKNFQKSLSLAYSLAEENHLVTLGIKPDKPSTGYGYIKKGIPLEMQKTFQVESFVEKPDLEKASEYIREGNYCWNSGMFIWRTDRILAEFKEHMPELFEILQKIHHLNAMDEDDILFEKIWTDIAPQTIDYGIMEKAADVVMVEADELDWNDVGSWDSLFEIMPNDMYGNVVKPENSILLETKNTLFFGHDDKKIFAAYGVKDLIIVETENAIMVCKKGQSQSVKSLIQEIKNKKFDRFL